MNGNGSVNSHSQCVKWKENTACPFSCIATLCAQRETCRTLEWHSQCRILFGCLDQVFYTAGNEEASFYCGFREKQAKGKEVRGLDLIRVTLATLFLMKDKVFSFWANYKTNVVTSNFATSKYESCHADWQIIKFKRILKIVKLVTDHQNCHHFNHFLVLSSY